MSEPTKLSESVMKPTKTLDQPLEPTSSTPSRPETPPTSASQVTSELESSFSSAPSSVPQLPLVAQKMPAKVTGKVTPIIPAVPLPKHARQGSVVIQKAEDVSSPATAAGEIALPTNSGENAVAAEDLPVDAPAPVKATPKSWADLVRTHHSVASASNVSGAGLPSTQAINPGQASSLGEVLSTFTVQNAPGNDTRFAFLEPRGLVNSGNMCYMNSVSGLSMHRSYCLR